MSENTEIWNLNALCRCCHKDGYFKSLQDTYIYETEVEVYAKMLRDAFDIEIKQPLLDASNSICEVCIEKLRHAVDFKKQVLECEKKFAVYCKNELISNGMEPVKIEADFDMDYDAEYNDEFEIKIKCDNPEDDITKKEEDDLYDQQAAGIKSEVTEDSKSIQIELQPLETKQDAKENGKKKKRVTKSKYTIIRAFSRRE
ncbi:uncharacterized protein LOC135085588 [Ostrinia nubilalis]|uniref:uncharacterized protein LOC135085588 n=1 Tax=Ostrinia nubilalis TaxID=29057 RepID=UPI0030824EF0